MVGLTHRETSETTAQGCIEHGVWTFGYWSQSVQVFLDHFTYIFRWHSKGALGASDE
jgi:hypothetical protein